MSKARIIQEAAEKAAAAEVDRTRLLLARAEKFSAAIIVLVGFQLLGANYMLACASLWIRGMCYLSLAFLGVSLFCAVWSLKVKDYAGYPRGNRAWDNLKADDISESAAEEAVIQMLLNTREQNAKLNDAKTRWLFWSGWLLFGGIGLIIGSHLLAALVVMVNLGGQ